MPAPADAGLNPEIRVNTQLHHSSFKLIGPGLISSHLTYYTYTQIPSHIKYTCLNFDGNSSQNQMEANNTAS
jgi:hypothetical protein